MASPSKRATLDVFRYLDYRVFLRELYLAQKKRGMSYRAFARRAGVGAPNYLKLVIDGQRNLSPELAQRFAQACGLAGEARDYFCELVAFGQAASVSERAERHARLLSFRRYRQAHRLEAAHADYHGSWYVPAVRELIGLCDFVEDPKWIADKLWPPIKPSEAKQALATLIKLGLVERDCQGRLRQTTSLVTTGAQTQSLHIARYHAEMASRAVLAMDLVPASHRELSSVTLGLGPRGLAVIKSRLAELRRELLQLAERESDACQVVQLNLQLFPLSRGSRDETRPTAPPSEEAVL